MLRSVSNKLSKIGFTTKSSRILILILVFISILSSTLYIQRLNTSRFEEFKAQFPFIDPARNFTAQSNFIANIQPLREGLNEYVKNKRGAEISIYFEMLNTGANIAINEDERFIPGSLIKMPSVLAAMKKIENGDWDLGNKLVIFSEDRNPNYGDLFKKPIGTQLTLDEIIKALIIDSDDTAHQVLVRNLSIEDYDVVLRGLGLETLFDEDYFITSKEYSRILRTLYTSSFLNRENSQYILNLLSQTNFHYFLEKGLDEGTIFSHKIGEHEPESTYLDSGIVYYPERPYIISVIVKLTEQTDRYIAEDIMKEISTMAFEYVKNF